MIKAVMPASEPVFSFAYVATTALKMQLFRMWPDHLRPALWALTPVRRKFDSGSTGTPAGATKSFSTQSGVGRQR
jgi:hypothetical protein